MGPLTDEGWDAQVVRELKASPSACFHPLEPFQLACAQRLHAKGLIERVPSSQFDWPDDHEVYVLTAVGMLS